jgi:uncharacterized membrane protein
MKSLLLSFALTSTVLAAPAVFQDILPTKPYVYPLSLSSDGSVLVGHLNAAGDSSAVLWTPSTGLQVLPKPAALSSYSRFYAYGVSADGRYAAGYGYSPDIFPSVPVRWNNSARTAQALPIPSGDTFGHIFALSDDGSIAVGNTGSSTGNQAVYWDAAGNAHPMGFLGGGGIRAGVAQAVSGNGQAIVGCSSSSAGVAAFRWTAESGMVNLGRFTGRDSWATTTSCTGDVIAGFCANGPAYPVRGWVWTDQAGMLPLGDLPGGTEHAHPHDMSADGRIIIGQSNSYLGDEAFIWDKTHGLRNLKSVLVSDYHLNLDGWTLQDAWSISADGNIIAGYGLTPAGEPHAWLVTLPEPTTGLLILAAACVAPWRRRRAAN